MSRFLFVTFAGGGNQPPAIGTAQALRERGHHAIFAGYLSQRSRFAELGFRFVVLERSQAALDQAGLGWPTLLDGVMVCPPQLDEVPRAFTQAQADLAVVDCMMFTALTACERTRLPAVVLAHSPPGALLRSDRILARAVPQSLNRLRTVAGLPAVERLDDCWRGIAIIATCIPELDPSPTERTEYVGPVFEHVPPSGWSLPWRGDDPRPLVLVSFSTGPGQDPGGSRIRRTLAGLANKPLRVLVTSSGVDLEDLAIPDNTIVVQSVPHGEILPFASVTVCHAGHGTVAASLAHGVPLVCLPHAVIADQVPIAEQVQQLGAGRALDGESATADDIAQAVDQVLTTPKFGEAARRLKARMETFGGATTSAARLEQLANS